VGRHENLLCIGLNGFGGYSGRESLRTLPLQNQIGALRKCSDNEVEDKTNAYSTGDGMELVFTIRVKCNVFELLFALISEIKLFRFTIVPNRQLSSSEATRKLNDQGTEHTSFLLRVLMRGKVSTSFVQE
jgi:hypothetical protein